ncbi:MAG TPA: tRNA glutamyl-Q(34) synthetase GluQRS [Planctomycetaceae bacterium]|nr:tRNA glutamyl-Q(34) synthetase GluQRS [Planctomycetaceae bacterium]
MAHGVREVEPLLVSQESSRTPVGRLAPSPTGKLHLGNARSFLLAWLSIRQQKGIMILRIEDIDSARVKPGAVQATMDDLRWLGLDWDFGPDLPPACVGQVPVTQSLRLDRYRQVLEQLILDGRVYPCRCTRSQIAQAASSAPHESSWAQLDGPIYPGTCRPDDRSPFFSVPSRSGSSDAVSPSDQIEQVALRWAFLPGVVQWHDQLLGSQSANPLKQLGDFVIGRASGLPAYQLAVVVDDYDMGVTEVVRGSDLCLSTFRQVDILRHLGWPIPSYYHVPLMLSSDGHRMAKRQGDSIAEFQHQRLAPEKIIGYLACSAGLIDRIEPVAARDLIGTLQWQRLPKHPTTFTGLLERVE